MEKRNTRQKYAIRDAFAETDRPLSPEEVHSGAQRRHPTVSLGTVYRNILTLVEEGWLKAVEVPGQSSRYERSGKKHHHHFHCTACDKVYELEGCDGRPKTKVPRGFRSTGHEYFFFGTCASCSTPAQRAHA